MKYNAFISYSHSQDSDLAPSLEKALEKFAKPIFKRRALNIFRDSNDLSVSPDLWGKIEEGLRQSEYFIYFASRKSAQSHYCGEEVKSWLKKKSIDNFLVVLTDGDIIWDFNNSDFDWNKTTALPKILSGVFENEPLYVDFRGEYSPSELTMENPDFKSKVVLLAATLHNKSVGDMVGEVIKQHKKTMLIRNGALSILSLLLITAVFYAYRATVNTRKAESLLMTAKASQILENNPTMAMRLAEMSWNHYPSKDKPNSIHDFIADVFDNSIVNKSLYYEDKISNPYIYSGNRPSIRGAAISPDGHKIAMIFDTNRNDETVGIIHTIETGDFIELVSDEKGSSRTIWSVKFSNNGEKIMVVYGRNVPKIWDSKSGKLLTEIKIERYFDFIRNATFSNDDKKIIINYYSQKSHGETAGIWDAENSDLLFENPDESIKLSPDGKYYLTSSGDNDKFSIYNTESGEWMADLEGEMKYIDKPRTDYKRGIDDYVFSLSGNKIISIHPSDSGPQRIWNAFTGKFIADLEMENFNGIENSVFSKKSKLIVTWNNRDGDPELWDAATGDKIANLGHEPSEIFYNIAFTKDGQKIITQSAKYVKIWNLDVLKFDFNQAQERIKLRAYDPEFRVYGYGSDEIFKWLKKTNIYKITNEDMEELGIDFIKLEY